MKKYDTYKVFDITIVCKDNIVRELFHTYAIECTENPRLFFFGVEESPTGEDQGLGHLTDEGIKKITDWLIDNGAEIGEVVIIDNYW